MRTFYHISTTIKYLLHKKQDTCIYTLQVVPGENVTGKYTLMSIQYVRIYETMS